MKPALCISIHDVAAVTWPQCRQLVAALQAVADVPLGLLLVPRWHGSRLTESPAFCAAVDAMLAEDRCHEIVLHGLRHRDDGPPPSSLSSYLQRRLITRGEGEFSALAADESLTRIRTGLADLQACGWQPTGFVPPAWMLGQPARAALQSGAALPGLRYASLFSGLLDVRSGRFVRAPALVYSARWPAGDALVRLLVSAWAGMASNAPLLRLGLHPADALRPATLRHAQRLVERALRDRIVLTEGQWWRLSHGKDSVTQAAKGVKS